MPISAETKQAVVARAANVCEYCRMHNAWEPFWSYHVEHIQALQHKGSDELTNLALACNHCNLVKGPNLASLDPDSGLLTPLFNPRHQNWSDHFYICQSNNIIGKTAIGRTTVELLRMNATNRLKLRCANEAHTLEI